MSEQVDLSKPGTPTALARLVGVSQPAISKLIGKDQDSVLLPGGSLGEWLLGYCKHQRSIASGRGGSKQESMAEARTNESIVKTGVLRLKYHSELGNLVPITDALDVLGEWAEFASREIESGVLKLVDEIESGHNITINDEMVNTLAGTTAKRIGSYALQLCERLETAGAGSIHTTDEAAHLGMGIEEIPPA